jgi:homoserine acetyltransferase
MTKETTGSHHAARRTKLEEAGFIDLWKGAGAALEPETRSVIIM